MYHSFLVVLFCASVTLSTGTFVTSPQNVTACTGNKAQFTCTIRLDQHGLILWYVKGVNFAALPPEYGASTDTYQERSDLLTSVLTINASPETNGTLVKCTGYSSTNEDINSEAFLSVQGQLAAPSNLAFTVDDYSVRLTWEAPFSLPGSDMEFKISVSIGGHSSSLTTPHLRQDFSYSSLNISRCDSASIEFTVCGVNAAGEGLPTPSLPVNVPPDGNLCNQHPDITMYLGVATGALVIMFVVALTTFIACYLLKRRKRQLKTEPSDFKMDSNTCYVTAKLKRNQAYEQPPHIYEVILLPTTVDA